MATSARTRSGNTLVAAMLSSPLHGVLDRRTALLTMTGRCSLRKINVPVDYSRDGRVIHVISRTGDHWWHNVEGGAHLTIRLVGVMYGAYGEVREMAEADRIHFIQGFWRDAYGRRLDTEHAAEIARLAVVIRVLLTDD